MPAVTTTTKGRTRSERLFSELDGRYVHLAPENRAQVRVFAVSRIAYQWWIQYALAGDVAGQQRFGMIAVGSRERSDAVLARIANEPPAAQTSHTSMRCC